MELAEGLLLLRSRHRIVAVVLHSPMMQQEEELQPPAIMLPLDHGEEAEVALRVAREGRRPGTKHFLP